MSDQPARLIEAFPTSTLRRSKNQAGGRRSRDPRCWNTLQLEELKEMLVFVKPKSKASFVDLAFLLRFTLGAQLFAVPDL